MLKLFPLPSFLERFASKRVVNVAIFGSGLSTIEWSQVCASYWHHHENFIVNLVNDPAEADVLAVHGPLLESVWPFFQRWIEARSPVAKIMAIGMEVVTVDGRIIGPTGESSDYRVDMILPGHPPTPGALKASLSQLMSRGASV